MVIIVNGYILETENILYITPIVELRHTAYKELDTAPNLFQFTIVFINNKNLEIVTHLPPPAQYYYAPKELVLTSVKNAMGRANDAREAIITYWKGSNTSTIPTIYTEEPNNAQQEQK